MVRLSASICCLLILLLAGGQAFQPIGGQPTKLATRNLLRHPISLPSSSNFYALSNQPRNPSTALESGFLAEEPRETNSIQLSLPGIHSILLLEIGVFLVDHVFRYRYNYVKRYLYLWHGLSRFKFWQPLSSCFCHRSTIHLASNLAFLLPYGRSVQAEFGPKGALLTFSLCGIVSSLVSLSFLPARTVSVGAAGGMLGIFLVAVTSQLEYLARSGISRLLSNWRILLEVLVMGLFTVRQFAEEISTPAYGGKRAVNLAVHLAGVVAAAIASRLILTNGSQSRVPRFGGGVGPPKLNRRPKDHETTSNHQGTWFSGPTDAGTSNWQEPIHKGGSSKVLGSVFNKERMRREVRSSRPVDHNELPDHGDTWSNGPMSEGLKSTGKRNGQERSQGLESPLNLGEVSNHLDEGPTFNGPMSGGPMSDSIKSMGKSNGQEHSQGLGSLSRSEYSAPLNLGEVNHLDEGPTFNGRMSISGGLLKFMTKNNQGAGSLSNERRRGPPNSGSVTPTEVMWSNGNRPLSRAENRRATRCNGQRFCNEDAFSLGQTAFGGSDKETHRRDPKDYDFDYQEVYLNGHEVAASCTPDGRVNYGMKTSLNIEPEKHWWQTDA